MRKIIFIIPLFLLISCNNNQPSVTESTPEVNSSIIEDSSTIDKSSEDSSTEEDSSTNTATEIILPPIDI